MNKFTAILFIIVVFWGLLLAIDTLTSSNIVYSMYETIGDPVGDVQKVAEDLIRNTKRIIDVRI
ncbi:MAG: hypothetical protein ACRCX2_12790 [Paraclostridium sp.]